MPADDKFILSEFKKTLRRKSEENVVDLDESLGNKFGFTFQTFQDILRDSNKIIPPNRWSLYRIGLVENGSGEFVTGMYKFKASKNTLVVIPSRVITSSRNWTADTVGSFVLFNLDFLLQNNFTYKHVENKKILSGSFQPYIHTTPEQAAEIIPIFEAIRKGREMLDGRNNEILALKMIELLITCERLFDEHLHFEANAPMMDIVRQFAELVEKNFVEQRSVRFYAEQLHLHPNYLSSLIKINTGATVKESLQNRLLLEAKYLLHTTNCSIKEISSQLGFNDQNYFTSFFTKLENVSPLHYRALFV
jgi:AraC-like DNA-binding protein